jgi:hypothetical protein
VRDGQHSSRVLGPTGKKLALAERNGKKARDGAVKVP